MNIQPAVTTIRFAKLTAGEFCIVLSNALPYAALCVSDPTDDGDPAMLILGPSFPQGMKGITLRRPAEATVLTYEKNFVLRLPVEPAGWTCHLPQPEEPSILLVGEKAYFVANYGDGSGHVGYPCYIDIASGLVLRTTATQIQKEIWLLPPVGKS